jgi:hypothetical protein
VVVRTFGKVCATGKSSRGLEFGEAGKNGQGRALGSDRETGQMAGERTSSSLATLADTVQFASLAKIPTSNEESSSTPCAPGIGLNAADFHDFADGAATQRSDICSLPGTPMLPHPQFLLILK